MKALQQEIAHRIIDREHILPDSLHGGRTREERMLRESHLSDAARPDTLHESVPAYPGTSDEHVLVHFDDRTRREHDRALEHALELAEIPRPGIFGKAFEGTARCLVGDLAE